MIPQPYVQSPLVRRIRFRFDKNYGEVAPVVLVPIGTSWVSIEVENGSSHQRWNPESYKKTGEGQRFPRGVHFRSDRGWGQSPSLRGGGSFAGWETTNHAGSAGSSNMRHIIIGPRVRRTRLHPSASVAKPVRAVLCCTKPHCVVSGFPSRRSRTPTHPILYQTGH
jgi:hypothetical protein